MCLTVILYVLLHFREDLVGRWAQTKGNPLVLKRFAGDILGKDAHICPFPFYQILHQWIIEEIILFQCYEVTWYSCFKNDFAGNSVLVSQDRKSSYKYRLK